MSDNFHSINGKDFQCFEKSLKISRAQKSDGDILNALSQLAINRHCHQKIVESDKLLEESAELLRKSPAAANGMKGNARRLLQWLAKKRGRAELAQACERFPIVKKGFLDATTIAIFIPLLLIFPLAASIGFVSGALKFVILIICFDRANRRLENSADGASTITALNHLITIDLYRGNIERAWQNSNKLLAFVGEKTTCAIPTRTSQF